MFIITFEKTRNFFLFRSNEFIFFTPSQSVYLKFILIASYIILLGLKMITLMHIYTQKKTCVYLSSLLDVPYSSSLSTILLIFSE